MNLGLSNLSSKKIKLALLREFQPNCLNPSYVIRAANVETLSFRTFKHKRLSHLSGHLMVWQLDNFEMYYLILSACISVQLEISKPWVWGQLPCFKRQNCHITWSSEVILTIYNTSPIFFWLKEIIPSVLTPLRFSYCSQSFDVDHDQARSPCWPEVRHFNFKCNLVWQCHIRFALCIRLQW